MAPIPAAVGVPKAAHNPAATAPQVRPPSSAGIPGSSRRSSPSRRLTSAGPAHSLICPYLLVIEPGRSRQFPGRQARTPQQQGRRRPSQTARSSRRHLPGLRQLRPSARRRGGTRPRVGSWLGARTLLRHRDFAPAPSPSMHVSAFGPVLTTPLRGWAGSRTERLKLEGLFRARGFESEGSQAGVGAQVRFHQAYPSPECGLVDQPLLFTARFCSLGS